MTAALLSPFPVLMAFTNHALDHMLLSVLDASITSNIVRLGSRTTDERIAEYNLHKLEQMAPKRNDRSLSHEWAKMKNVEEEMVNILESIQLPRISWQQLEAYLDIHYPMQAALLRSPPFWITVLMETIKADEEENGEWTVQGSSKNKTKEEKRRWFADTPYGFWKLCRDLDFIRPPLPVQKAQKNRKEKETSEEDDSVSKVEDELAVEVDPRVAFFNSLGFHGEIPVVPSSNRDIEQLLCDDVNIWSMSAAERDQVVAVWEEEVRRFAYKSNLSEFEEQRARYRDACKRFNNVQDQVSSAALSLAISFKFAALSGPTETHERHGSYRVYNNGFVNFS
jgi:hypothetical protein